MCKYSDGQWELNKYSIGSGFGQGDIISKLRLTPVSHTIAPVIPLLSRVLTEGVLYLAGMNSQYNFRRHLGIRTPKP